MEIDICPRWLLNRFGVPPQARVHAAILFSTVLVLGAIPIAVSIPHLCLFRVLLGIPCPGCGVLHGLMGVAALDFGAAWRSNPAALAVATIFVFQIVARPLALMQPQVGGTVSKMSQRCSDAVIGCLLLVWIFRLITGGIHGGYLLPQM